MRAKNYVLIGLLIIGILYVYHMFIAQPGTIKAGLAGLGINR